MEDFEDDYFDDDEYYDGQPHEDYLNVVEVMTILIMTIKSAQNAGGMPKKKPGVKPENPNRQIMKWETQTFLQGDGFKMFANILGI